MNTWRGTWSKDFVVNTTKGAIDSFVGALPDVLPVEIFSNWLIISIGIVAVLGLIFGFIFQDKNDNK